MLTDQHRCRVICAAVCAAVIGAAAGEIFDRTKMMRAAPEVDTETADMHVSSSSLAAHCGQQQQQQH
jgi:hypothetical protein